MSLSLAYREYGSGAPMVILHGLFGSAQNWHTMAERLGESYRVLACDLRNHGDSPWARTMGYAEMADDLEALIEEKQAAPAVVLGHSVGGKAAMLVALKHPHLIEALVVVDIAPVTYQERFDEFVAAMQGADLSGDRPRARVEQALAKVVPDAATRLFLMQNLVERDGGLAWRINLEALAANMDELLGFPDVSALAYDGRALFVSGAQSDYIGQTYQGQIYDLFPQAEFAVITDAGHYPHIEQPEQFFARVTDFLESAYA